MSDNHWLTLGESATGTSHLAKSTPCQDAFRVVQFGDQSEWLAIAVADGAGSASFSQIGATLVCDEFARLAPAIPESERCSAGAITALFEKGRAALYEEAERRELSARELACTALLAIVGPLTAIFAQLGDGAIVHSVGEELHVAFWPEPGEYANATDFLTDANSIQRLQVLEFAGTISKIAVFTDGLQRLALDFSTQSAFPGFFMPLFRDLGQVEDTESLQEPFRGFLDSERVNQRTDDDKTLVLAVRR